ncbi:aromatic amino acid lyase, partial [Actinoplanes philippinensis]|uniref:aromatic amino acid lyase n=1 Tax=Actinoplanes philippinensis TaxID=35752 RepID=UPI0033EC436B
MTFEVDLAAPLSIADLRAAREPITVLVGPAVRERLTAGRVFLAKVLGDDRAVYGATTGFGALVGYAGRADQRDQADNTLAHLGAGQGP